MSDIKAGDLVMVVRGTPCCDGPKDIGIPFTVERVVGSGFCLLCLKPNTEPIVVAVGELSGFAVSQLIKIDPPALPSTEREKELVLR
jgi:hypothetical protein